MVFVCYNLNTSNQGPPRAGVWRNRFVRTDTYTQMCTIYYVPAACREQCTIDPSPIRVISKFKKNLAGL